LFVHFIYAVNDQFGAFSQYFISSIFSSIPEIDNLVLALDAGVHLPAALYDGGQTFTSLRLTRGPEATTKSLFVAERKNLAHLGLKALEVRKAKVEDHDDLLPVFERRSQVLLRSE
jgi:hypothetical protein